MVDKEKAKAHTTLLEKDQQKCSPIPATVDLASLDHDDSNNDNSVSSSSGKN